MDTWPADLLRLFGGGVTGVGAAFLGVRFTTLFGATPVAAAGGGVTGGGTGAGGGTGGADRLRFFVSSETLNR